MPHRQSVPRKTVLQKKSKLEHGSLSQNVDAATSGDDEPFTCRNTPLVASRQRRIQGAYPRVYLSFGQGSSLLWTHMPRPLQQAHCANPGRGGVSVNDACKCMRDCRVGWAEQDSLSGIYSAPLLGVAYCIYLRVLYAQNCHVLYLEGTGQQVRRAVNLNDTCSASECKRATVQLITRIGLCYTCTTTFLLLIFSLLLFLYVFSLLFVYGPTAA